MADPRRILLAGDPPPDDSLHRVIERNGGTAVVEITECEPGDLPTPAPRIDALADMHHARRNPVLAMREDAQWIVKRARQAKVDAVVFWLIEEDESLPWEIARQMRGLQAAGIPALLLSRQAWQADEAALRQVGKFVGEMKR